LTIPSTSIKVFVAELHRLMAQSEKATFDDGEREHALQTAERLVEEALEADADCAQAYVQRGMCRLLRIGQQMPATLDGIFAGAQGGKAKRASVPEGRAAAVAAEVSAEQGAEAHGSAVRERTEADVISQFEEALRRDPQNHVAHLHWAMVSMQLAIFEVRLLHLVGRRAAPARACACACGCLLPLLCTASARSLACSCARPSAYRFARSSSHARPRARSHIPLRSARYQRWLLSNKRNGSS
jgi:hypothetical protein